MASYAARGLVTVCIQYEDILAFYAAGSLKPLYKFMVTGQGFALTLGSPYMCMLDIKDRVNPCFVKPGPRSDSQVGELFYFHLVFLAGNP